MKLKYILGMLAFLVFAVGSASASAPYDITVSNTGLPIDIIVTYNQATGLLTFFDNNYIAGSQGILAIAYNANVKGSDLTTVPTMASGNQAWTYNGGPQGDAKGELGTFTTSWGKTASKVYQQVTIKLPIGTVLSENGVHNFVCVHYKWNVIDPKTGKVITGFGSENKKTTPIPEFPTIALPVAGILGLMLILGRRNRE